LKKLWLALFIGFSLPAAFANGPIPESVILSKVLDGSGRWESALIFYAMESIDQEGLDHIVSRQKMVTPKFQSDLLYYRYTYDDQWEYKFYFNYIHSQCLYEVQKRESVRMLKLCRDDINNCRSKLSEKIDKSDLMSCRQKSNNCSKLGDVPKVSVVDKKYCEKLYGRSL